MSPADAAGLAGVLLILIAYGAATLGRVTAEHPASLAANFVGASLILYSLLTEDFNLSATVMEGAWAVFALAGLVRWGLGRLRRQTDATPRR